MPRAGLSTAAVVEAALLHVDEHGADGLTLAAVAGRTGVAAPSLYKHVRNLAELRRLVATRVMDEFSHRLGVAVMGRSGDDAVAALMRAWREYVKEYPGRYAAIPSNPLSDPALAEPSGRQLEIILAVLRGYGLEGAAAIHATRCLRSAGHGFASLEAAGGFGLPEDLDTTFEHLMDMLIAGLHELSSATPATDRR
ncbi:TetR/AcrR family transcriptional regulator [Actinopolymorpha alba]|uniref:TetR/AcrR family transcriptional regulator n=1 Tax=Actinopolymorpha alba TaxID=533267 RepID=UPI0012F6C02B|nr:TetR/AcrR family transcriptional regulator [Actinopolymorpha alba]